MVDLRIVGLTGNVASGKSTVAALWRQAGVPVVSADELARRAVEPGSPALAEVEALFGPGVLQEDGSLDRGAVRRIVFDDPAALQALEAVVHPVVGRLRDEWTEAQRAAGAPLVAWEIPLLFETGMEDHADLVVFVDAPEETRLRRIVATRGLTEEEARSVMEAQMPPEEKRLRSDVIIDNAGSLDLLERRAREVLDQVRRMEL